uniref:Ycf66 n=1 Tax=Toxarium undulatum TaxID=210620 RepID=A0A1D8D9G7_9STRA|nr:hypothetical protein [Toxarium undulatum]AOS86590.1 hypothetical protein [Toxarium undulatum]
MLNISFSTNIILGLVWILGSLLVQLIGIIEPRISDEKDSIIVASLFLSGFILIIHGWRLDPILMFVQELFTLILGIIIYEMMRGRYITIILFKKLNTKQNLDFFKLKKK